MYTLTEFSKAPLFHQSLGPLAFLFLSQSFSLSLYFWLIPWSAKAGSKTQGILASVLLSLSYRRLWTTRFWSIKGPQHITKNSCILFLSRNIFVFSDHESN